MSGLWSCTRNTGPASLLLANSDGQAKPLSAETAPTGTPHNQAVEMDLQRRRRVGAAPRWRTLVLTPLAPAGGWDLPQASCLAGKGPRQVGD